MLKKIKNTTEFIQDSTDQFQPQIGIILGTGLGGLVNDVNIEHEIEYEDIPSFPVSTVESHKGKLIFGELSGKKVIIMQGRFHYYEGYSLKEVAFPVQVMKFLGVKTLLISNAAGGLNSSYKKGDLML
jgi:purine-nucleoside phosphorylase